jgi:hypothetical protein
MPMLYYISTDRVVLDGIATELDRQFGYPKPPDGVDPSGPPGPGWSLHYTESVESPGMPGTFALPIPDTDLAQVTPIVAGITDPEVQALPAPQPLPSGWSRSHGG